MTYLQRAAWLSLSLAVAGAACALKVADPTPKLTFKALNVEGDAIELGEASGNDFGVLFINPAHIGDDDKEVANLIGFMEVVHKEGVKAGKPAHAYVVWVGAADSADTAKAFLAKAELTVPLAVIAPDDEQLKAWDLPAELHGVLYGTKTAKIENIFTSWGELEKSLKPADK